MSDAFSLLDLTSDADERAIKRAYARLLKLHRPDEDPEGFQRINQAYQCALDDLRHRLAATGSATGGQIMQRPRSFEEEVDGAHIASATHPTTDSPSPQPPKPTPDPEPHPAPVLFDAASFKEGLQASLADPDPRKIRAWLLRQDALYSIELKQALRPLVIRAIYDTPRIGSTHVAELLLDFFGLDRMDRDGLFLEAQTALEWKRREEQFDSALRKLRQPGSDFVQRQIGHELAGETSWQRRWFLLLSPNGAARVGYTLANLRRLLPSLQHAELDAAVIGFWDQVLDKRKLHPARIGSALGRLMPITLAFFVVLTAMATPQDRPRLILIGSAVAAGMVPLWFLYAFWKMRRGQWGMLFERRWQLAPGSFTLLAWLAIGLIAAWCEPVAPGRFGLGVLFLSFLLLFVCARLQQGQPGWSAMLSIISLVVTPAALGGASMIVWPGFSPLRFKILMTLSALPLVFTVWMRRPGRLQRMAPWIMPAFALLSLAAAALVKSELG